MAARIQVNRRGITELLTSAKVAADLRSRAETIASAADVGAGDPGGHRVESEVGRRRARSAVITATPKSRWKEANLHTLIRAFGAGRRG